MQSLRVAKPEFLSATPPRCFIHQTEMDMATPIQLMTFQATQDLLIVTFDELVVRSQELINESHQLRRESQHARTMAAAARKRSRDRVRWP